VFVANGIRKSRTGRVLIAMRDNERTAQAFGVNLVRTRLVTFAISGFLAAFAGVLFAHHQHAVSQKAFLPSDSVQMFLMAVIGGLGSITGVLLGPIYLGLTSVFLVSFQLLASSVGVVFVLLFLPGGIGAAAFAVRDSYLRRVAIRNRIFVPSLLADYRTDGQISKVPLVPRYDLDGNVEETEQLYRLDSRIRVAGSSQLGKTWSM
jgi:branched-chain amino acid transport system permease protein